MLALTARVTHKTLFERVQFAMFLQLLGALSQTITRALDSARGLPSSRIGSPLGPKTQLRPSD